MHAGLCRFRAVLVLALLSCAGAQAGHAMMPAAIYAAGSEVALGDFSMTLDRAVLMPGGENSPSGATVEIDYTVRNISRGPVSLVGFPALTLEDRNGITHPAEPDAASARTLAPGVGIKAIAKFHIPDKSAAPLGWRLRLGSGGPAVLLR